ncbi:TATA-binding protein-associated factor [Porphyridium purpureum]|uniref:TATA-binding protein-associated factor n=1 Tax=Porphyridium purpureum TaxID=35688 RepID=A0A5J4YPX9_PORPP|nr:TATA-binding protein-associated factor [Porphyridium purpureum]|eukprot:POR9658..scf222_8
MGSENDVGEGHGASSSVSRLDQLIEIIASGRTAELRRLAAAQVGELVAAHPLEAAPVLRRVCALLTSKSWDCRLAAGSAVAAIADVTPGFSAAPAEPASASARASSEQAAACFVSRKWLTLEKLALDQILSHGAQLFGSTGDEYVVAAGSVDVREQRRQLRMDLGLDSKLTGSDNTQDEDDMLGVKDEDLAVQQNEAPRASSAPHTKVEELIVELAEEKAQHLSARERNRLKREAKRRIRGQNNSAANGKDFGACKQQSQTGRKRSLTQFKTSNVVNGRDGGVEDEGDDTSQADGLAGASIDDVLDYYEKADEQFTDAADDELWIFNSSLEFLREYLLNESWEMRHGAALGFREILMRHASSVGRRSADLERAEQENKQWLEDMVCRMLCVLALDRFGDFVGDTVVAPVRETAAMAIGAAARPLPLSTVRAILEKLLFFLHKEYGDGTDPIKGADTTTATRWEVRHAGLLGIKYLLAVRRDEAHILLARALPHLQAGVQDEDDDVRAVAASCFLPLSRELAAHFRQDVQVLVTVLWDVLLDLDDLSASTADILELLGELVNLQKDDSSLSYDSDSTLESHIPRLFPFFRHAAVRVRRAALKCFEAMLERVSTMWCSEALEKTAKSCFQAILLPSLEEVYRCVIMDHDQQVTACSKRLWRSLISLASNEGPADSGITNAGTEAKHLLIETANAKMQSWVELACFETRSDALQFDRQRSQGMNGSSSVAVTSIKGKSHPPGKPGRRQQQQQQQATRADVHIEGGDEGVEMQLAAAEALAELSLLPDDGGGAFVHSVILPLTRSARALERRVALDMFRSVIVKRRERSHAGVPVPLTDADAAVFEFVTELVQSGGSTGSIAELVGRSSRGGPILGGMQQQLFTDVLALLNMYRRALGRQMDDAIKHVESSVIVDSQNRPTIHLNALETELDRVLAAVGSNGASHGLDVEQVSSLVIETLTVIPQALTGAHELWTRHRVTAAKSRETSTSNAEDQALGALRLRVLTTIGFLTVRRQQWVAALGAAAASVLIESDVRDLPKAVGAVIKAVLAGVRTVESDALRAIFSRCTSVLVWRLHKRPPPNKPLALLCKNLGKFLSHAENALVLYRYEVAAESAKGTGSPAAGTKEPPHVVAARREAQGLVSALKLVCQKFGETLWTALPWLWDFISAPLVNFSACASGSVGDHADGGGGKSSELLDAIFVVQAVADSVHGSLHDEFAALCKYLIQVAASSGGSTGNISLCELASQALGKVVLAMPSKGMQVAIATVLPMLDVSSGTDASSHGPSRVGAIRALLNIVESLDLALIPYAAFLVIPAMSRMVDTDAEVRECASLIFGNCVRLMPLEQGSAGAADDQTWSEHMKAERQRARTFMAKLTGAAPRDPYVMQVPIGDGVSLRHYQQDCLDWLAFLNEYQLHGALCDDMGLGKTLMTLCIIANETFKHEQRLLSTAEAIRILPSLVVCPCTLVGHWAQEAERFFGPVLSPVLMYYGNAQERSRARALLGSGGAVRYRLIIASYEALASDLDVFVDTQWKYLVADEGHVIKNVNTKVSRAVRRLNAAHRLLLSGTPIQNSVYELWSIFDFLMPGFLGTQKEFRDKYGKPIMASRDPKCTEQGRADGKKAMESLHRQVLPFIMRRVKDDVLQELPPKIIQDLYSDMSPLQAVLYEEFSERVLQSGFELDNKDRESLIDDGTFEDAESGGSSASTHVFQALQYLRRLCSHPKLVLQPGGVLSRRAAEELEACGASLNDVDVSSKLASLRELLVECGIGTKSSAPTTLTQDDAGHRVLIFAQYKAMLDIVEEDLLRKVMPSVSFMRLDGSVEVSKRHGIVTRFNADPTIDVLLLTTQVGGLGLNLTGADTVVFLEHDWNPAKDLQAMDRAHRMGQKRTVNVYRLITRGSLEEKVLGLQRFKQHVANTVINKSNASLAGMNTGQLLELFHVGTGSFSRSSQQQNSRPGLGSRGSRVASSKLQDALEDLDKSTQAEQMDDGDDAYGTDFDVNAYLKAIEGKK